MCFLTSCSKIHVSPLYPTEIINQLKYLPLNPFRSVYNYTNFGLTTAAEAVAQAHNLSWSELAQKRLYNLLGMTSTSSTYTDFISQPNKALGNIIVDGKWIATPQQRQPDAQSPAGGVSSSAIDMANWRRMVLGGGVFEGKQIIAPEALQEVFIPHMVSSPAKSITSRSSFYGLGFGTNTDGTGLIRLSHSGAFLLGASTSFALLPAENLGIVILTNGTPVGLSEAIAASFLDLVETGSVQFDWLSLYGQRFRQMSQNKSILAGKHPPSNPQPAKALEAYTGNYDNDYYGSAQVTIAPEGNLLLTIGAKPLQFPLKHWDGDRFAFYPTGENAVGISAITFTMSDQGEAQNMAIEFFDEYGLGTFTHRP